MIKLINTKENNIVNKSYADHKNMKTWCGLLVFGCIFALSAADGDDDDKNYVVTSRPFPDGFMFGLATAAHQIEGAWNEDGKGEQIWDTWIHEHPNVVFDGSNGDVAVDSYHKYMDDIACLKEVGVQYYRLSISWARILPNGRNSNVNKPGIDYYLNVLRALKDAGIQAMVTLYHWDLPTALQNDGGWTNPEIVDLFGDYARLCYQLFGEYVQMWNTINEPKQICHGGYGIGAYAPGILSPGVDEYKCSKYVLLAHARAWRIYNDEFRSTQNGKITIVIDSDWYEPGTDADKEAAETRMQFIHGLYGHPVYKRDWPDIVKQRIAMRSQLEGYSESRLPAFTEDEIDYVSGTYDFIALNHYTTYMISASDEPAIGTPSLDNDAGVTVWQKDTWQTAAIDWFKYVPWGAGKLLRWLKSTYGDIDIMITENGVSDQNGTLTDDHRIRFYTLYMSHMLDAVYEENVRLTGFTAWTIMDNFEWTLGYIGKSGIYYVDMNDPDRKRVPKKSSTWYANVIKTGCLVDSCT
ncbi:hypothetical protein NQ318_005389 [Aromia moschata]|uniref:Uncharacterized protein n=1 Tax=Aromia moschata TaxID=1265417 RepID=A0AAV8YWA3_9CUCU|nr:hypothetical protein NQ318_005389 [Aromia moschata]